MQQIAGSRRSRCRRSTMICRCMKPASIRWAFAILVARLEDDLGVDPFTISEDAAFPLTVGDFIKAYENVPA